MHKQTEKQNIRLNPYQSIFYYEWIQDPSRCDYNIIMDSTVTGNIDIDRFSNGLIRLASENLIFCHNVLNNNGKLSWKHRTEKSKIVFYYPRELSDPEMYRIISKPFDLENDLLLKVLLIKLSEDKYRILFIFPHISIDGISTDEMYVEWANYYNDENYRRSTTMLDQYKMQEHLYNYYEKILNDNLSKINDFWTKHLSNVSGIDLSFLKKTTILPEREFRYVTEQKFTFDTEIFLEVKKLKSYKITPYLFGQMVLAVLMHKVSKNECIGINYPIAMTEGKELPYGAHVNTLIIDYRFNEKTTINELITNILSFFSELKSTKAKYLPINEIVKFAADKSVLEMGFAQTFLRDHPIDLEGVCLEKVNHQFHIDLVNKLLFEQEEYESKLNYRIRYDDHVLDSELVKNFISMYIKLFNDILTDLNNGLADKKITDYDLLSAEEQNKILYKWNNTQTDYLKKETLPGLFEKQVEQTPERIAFNFRDKTYSYATLNAKANQLAHYLNQKHQISPEEKIVLLLERSEWMILSILGVLKSGAAYIPLDPDIPDERLKYILKNTNAKLIITNTKLRNKLDTQNITLPILEVEKLDLESMPTDNLKINLQSNNLAYIIFTSGTTGMPKGVMIEHHSAVNLAINQGKLFGLSPDSDLQNCLWYANYTFDAHVSEVFTALGNGHSLFLIDGKERADICALQSYIKNNKINIATIPPVLLNRDTLLPLDTLVVAGDVTNTEVMLLYKNNGVKVLNAYGPTEATVCSTLHYYNEGDLNTNIGSPIGNTKAYVLDRDLQPLPVGVIGELYIGGAGVARGYCNNEDLTAKSFIKNPFRSEYDIQNNENEYIYKTGDLVRFLPDGNIDYIGRDDHQVKVRGYRIELGEIENRLIEVPGITKVAVIARSNPNGNKYIAAYYIADKELDRTSMENYLAQYLPDYMLPTTYTHLDAFPSTINGKLDVKQLPAPEFNNSENYTAPRTDLEKTLCEIFANILGLDPSKVGVDDDFIHLGGDSISSIQLINKLRQLFDLRISVKDIFKYKTVRSVSVFIENETKKGQKIILSEQGILKDSLNLLPIQKWFFDNIDEGLFVDYNHWNQSFMLDVPKLDKSLLEKSLQILQEHHDAFHLGFSKSEEQNNSYIQYYQYPLQPIKLDYVDVRDMAPEILNNTLDQWQKNFHIFDNNLFHIGYLEGYPDGRARIHFALHHLIVDAVSWRIIKNDLFAIYSYLTENKISVDEKIDSKTILGEKGTSYRQWTSEILDHNEVTEDNLWIEFPKQMLSYNKLLQGKRIDTYNQSQFTLDKAFTAKLVGEVNHIYNTKVNDLLLTSLSCSLHTYLNTDLNYVTLEGHGREEIFSYIDINNTMGWFTTMYPIQLRGFDKLEDTLIDIKNRYREVPYNGIGYGALMGYKNSELPAIGFNYLGQFDSPSHINSQKWEFANEYVGQTISPLNKDKNLISINSAIVNGELQLYLGGNISSKDLAEFGELFKSNLNQIVTTLSSAKRGYMTLSDIDFITHQRVLDQIQAKQEVEGIYMANSLQQGFVVHALSQGVVDEAYRTQLIWEYSSPIDETKLKQAWEYAQKKYPTLRLRFSWDDQILQIIDKKCTVDWRFFDISHQNESAQKTFIDDILHSDKSENYDLSKSGLFRLYLIKQGNSQYVCIFNNHHAIMDGWSNPVLLMYVHDCYLKLLKNQKVDFSVDSAYIHSQEYLQNHQENSLAFWNDYIGQFDIAEDLSSLLKADKRHIKLSEYKHVQSPQIAEKTIEGGLFKTLKAICRNNNITFNTLLQYSWHKQLCLYGTSDVTVTGMTVSGRNIPVEGVEESVGLYINTLPVVLQHREGNIIDLIKELQGYINEINNHSEVSLAKIQKGGDRLFNTLFVYENYPLPKDFNSGNDLSVKFHGITEKQDYTLVLTAYEEDAKATIKLQYASELFDERMIEQLLNGIKLFVNQLSLNPNLTSSALRYLDNTKYNEVVNSFNADRVENIPDTTIHATVEKQVALYPQNIAIDYEGKSVSYSELNTRANRLAQFLIDNYDVKPDDFVGLVLDRSDKLVTSILAVLKAGGAYVPMDPKAPEDRLTFMIEDSAPKVILTNSSNEDRLKAILPNSIILAIDDIDFEKQLESKYNGKNLDVNISSYNIAYLIYTSGTTGMPKGVMVEHRNVINLFGATDKLFNFNEHDVWTLFHSYTFDFSVWELLGSLFFGGKLLVPTYEQTRDMNMFYDLCARKGVTVLNQTPNAFYQFSDIALTKTDKLTSLRYVVFGGEALNMEQLQPWYSIYEDNSPSLINMYGITETTVHVTYKKIYKNELDRGSLIGKPIPNYSIYLLNKDMQPLPIGAIGEMYVGGEGVARGYLNKDELTAERFLPNPFQTDDQKEKGINSRLYKSGDLARLLPSGELEYLGRNDFQVKIRGFRIELCEIENRLSSHQSVKQSVVLVKEHTSGGKYLVGYYVADNAIDSDSLIAFMKAYLPDYMIPSAFVHLSSFPLTVNGKLDRKALPEPSFSGNVEKNAPRNETEEQICAMYSAVLGVKEVGIDDDFFKLGGDSISSIQLISRLRQKLGIQIKVKDVFDHRTVKELYKNVILGYDATNDRLPAEEGVLSGEAPLLPIQSWFFDNAIKGIYPQYNYWNQTFLIKVPSLDKDILKISLDKLFNYHDTFKLRYKKEQNQFSQYYYPEIIDVQLDTLDINSLSDTNELDSVLTNWQNNFDILSGKLFHVGYISGHEDGYDRIYFAFHHLIIDIVSWRIIKNDLQSIYEYLLSHKDTAPESVDVAQILGAKSNSYRQWAQAIDSYGSRPEYSNEKIYWEKCIKGIVNFNSSLKTKDTANKSEVKFALTKTFSQQLLKDVNHVFGTEINDILLSVLSIAMQQLTGLDNNYVLLEGHGRESVFPELDVSSTIGWFTSLYPLQLSSKSIDDLDKVIVDMKHELKQLPNNGVGYGALMGYTANELPLVSFNYLGQFDEESNNSQQWSFVRENIGKPVGSENKDTALLSITGVVFAGELNIIVAGTLCQDDISTFANNFKTKLEEVVTHLSNKKRSYLTSSDIESIISDRWLNQLQKEHEIEAIYKANSLQQGFIYHALSMGDIDSSYRTQLIWDYYCSIDPQKLLSAWQYAQQKFPTLRLRFAWDEELVQIIDKEGLVEWQQVDISSMNSKEQENYVQNLIAEDRNIPYDLSKGSLFRIYLIKKAENSYTCLLNNHHAILDGWSNPVLLGYVHDTYVNLVADKQISISEDISYLKAQDYLQKHTESNKDFWNRYVEQIENTDDLSALMKNDQKQINLSEYKFIKNIQQETLVFDKKLSLKLKEYCSALGITLNAFLQYLWHKDLSIYESSETTVVGMTVAGRSLPIEGIEQSAGLYINTLPLVVNHEPQKISEALINIQKNINDINDRSNIDLAKLQKQGIRIFNTLFIFENYPSPDEQREISDLVFKFREVIEKQDYPLTVTAFEQNQEVIFKLQYAEELFSANAIKSLLARINKFANDIVNNPDLNVQDLTYLLEDEVETVLYEWNKTRVSFSTDTTFDVLFEQQANRTPDSVAVVHKGNKLTYRELSNLSSQLAVYLKQQLTVEVGDMVALYLDRSENIIVSILAIMKVGAVYVPMDTKAPADRIGYILSDIRAKAVITDKHNIETLENLNIKIESIKVDDALFWTNIAETCQDKSILDFEKSSTNLIYTLFTSGTTGKPKGVMIEHHSYLNLLFSYRDKHFKDRPSVNTMSTTNYVFDIWGLEYGLPLLSGGLVELSGSDFKNLDASKYDFIQMTPSVLSVKVDDIIFNNPDLLILVGGEALSDSLLKELLKNELKYVLNVYGPTETTIWSTDKINTQADNSLSIGKPIANTSVYILDKYLKPVPVGVIGELYIGGDGVGRGYFNNEEFTNQRFIANPFQQESEKLENYNGVIYQTGDLVRYLSNGNIEYIGRNDFQVKIRGHRIELSEIEASLLSYEKVRQAVIIVKENKANNSQKYLVAYYVSDLALNSDDLKKHLGKTLPDYMIPSVYIHLDKFPVNASGKLNRKALPEPNWVVDREYVAPQTELEAQLCKLYAQILSLSTEQISTDEDFLSLGGDSILSIKLVGLISRELNKNVHISDIFNYGTVKKLAQFLTQNGNTGSSIKAIEVTDPTKQLLSFAQERLSFIHSFEDGSSIYNMPMTFKLNPSVKVEALLSSIQEEVKRHEVLRSLIKVNADGLEYQEVQTDALVIEQIEISSIKELDQQLKTDIEYIFKLDSEYPIRARLYKLGNEYYMSIVIHHIAFDGWSVDIFMSELSKLYQYYALQKTVDIKQYPLKPLALQYKDFALWQRQYLEGDLLERELEYWKNKLDGFEILNLKTDKTRPLGIDYNGRDINFKLDQNLSSSIRLLAKENGVTLYSVLLSAFYLLLKSYSGQNDIVIGTAISNRNKVEIADLIGFFVNILALRENIDVEMSLTDFIKQVGNNINQAQQYQDLPFEKLVMELGVDEDPSRNPIFQVMFGLQRFGTALEKDNALFEPYRNDHTSMQVAKFDLSLMMDDSDNEITGSFNYAIALFNPETIERYIAVYKQILSELVNCSKGSQIKDLDVLPESERSLLSEWNETEQYYPKELTICDMFEKQVNSVPDTMAFVYEDKEYTYKQLDIITNQLAHYLGEELSVQLEDRIALFLDRNEYMMFSILGVLKSGGAYVPIDPEVPSERIEYLLENTEAKIVLTNRVYKERLSQFGVKVVAIEDIDLDCYKKSKYESGLTPTNLAYIIYTSGTTGHPKGVMIEHTSVVNLTFIIGKPGGLYFPPNLKKALWYANYVFDAHVEEIFLALLNGQTLYLIDKDTRTDIYRLKEYIETNEIDKGTIPPVLLNKDCILPLKIMIVAGDVTNGELMEIYCRHGVDVFNGYGPTEGTVCDTFHHYHIGDLNTNIGKPIKNNKIYVLDSTLKPVPIGGVGELYIGGVGVGRGYLNNAELTKERFINNPFQSNEDKLNGLNSRIYKTGDTVRFLPNGDLDYMGRNDHQVKIRGIRIELGEIENTLMQYFSINQSAVVVRTVGNNKCIAAYYTSASVIDTTVLDTFLSQRLPEFMLPSSYTWLSELPRTINGKINVKALPEPDLLNANDKTKPKTELESRICQIFADILGIDVSAIGINDDFFRLGGNSILAMKLLHRLNKILNSNIRISEIFKNRTVAKLKEILSEKDDSIVIKAVKVQDPEKQVLSFAQERLWFIGKMDQDSTAYNIPIVFKLSENAVLDSFLEAIRMVVHRHEILRSLIRLSSYSTGYQLVADDNKTPLSVDIFEMSSEAEMDHAIQKALEYKFKLDSEFPIHVSVFKLDSTVYITIVVHHIAFDGWSADILLKEIINYYKYLELVKQGKTEDSEKFKLVDLPVQYKDYALWQRGYLTGKVKEQQLEYWKNHLEGVQMLELPLDNSRPSKPDYIGGYTFYSLDADTSRDLRNLSKDLGISLHSLLLSGCYLLLSVYSNQKDIVLGIPIANRNYTGIENLIGFFVNTLAIRQKIDDSQSLKDFIRDVGKNIENAQLCQDLPFDMLVNELDIAKDPSINPIFQVMFTLESFDRSSLEDIIILCEEKSNQNPVAKFDLTIIVDDSDEIISGAFYYAKAIFKSETIETFVNTYKLILKQFAELTDPLLTNRVISDLQYTQYDTRESNDSNDNDIWSNYEIN